MKVIFATDNSDELMKFNSLRLDLKYVVYESESVQLKTPESTNEYLGPIIREASNLATSAKNVMSEAFVEFRGDASITGNFEGFYYVACRVALIYS